MVIYILVIYNLSLLLPEILKWRGQRPKGGNSMNKYELAVVVSSKIEDDDRIATIERVKEIITKHGGTITNVDEWGKKRLAYEVQKMKDAFYYFIQFEGESTVPAEIESRVRIMENVIRYLCVRQDEE
jgi:small subunit ribosomal protein S6